MPSSGRRLSWILAGCLAVACGLNPQPDLPGSNDSTGTGAGGALNLGASKGTGGNPDINLGGGMSSGGTGAPIVAAGGESDAAGGSASDGGGENGFGGDEAGAAGQNALSSSGHRG